MRIAGAMLLTALSLLLTACGEPLPVFRETAVPPPESVSAAAGSTDKAVILPNGPLPQSAYVPPSPPPRFYAEITHTLTPRDDYGRIWPYVGGYVVQWWMAGDLIGLCDGEGRIVCDPVFNLAEIIEKDGKRLYKLTENRVDAEGKDTSKITLCKLDGSWAREYEGVAYEFPGSEYFNGSTLRWRPDFAYAHISVCENGRWGVIDYEGNELLPCKYNNPVCFSDGLAAVLSDDGETYRYIDIKGSSVLGPYKTPSPQQLNQLPFPISDPLIADVKNQTLQRYYGLFFSDGLARFYENGKYGVIDREGGVVVPAQYDFITAFYEGTAEILSGSSYDNFKYGLINASGRVLCGPEDVWLTHQTDGTVLLESPGGHVVLDPETGDKSPWNSKDPVSTPSYSQGSSGVVIYWDDGKQSFPYAANVAFLDNGNMALSSRLAETWYIADRSGAMLAGPFDGRAEDFRNGYIYVSAGMSDLNDGTDNTYHTLYNRDGNRVLPEVYREIIPFEGRYLVRQDACAGLLDEQGNWVIKTPIYDYLND